MDKKFVHDDEEKQVHVPGNKLSYKEVFDMHGWNFLRFTKMRFVPTGSRAGKFNIKENS